MHLCTPTHAVSWLKAQAEVTELSLKTEKCLQIGVIFFKIHWTGSRHPVTRRRTSLLASSLIQLFLGFLFCFFVMGQRNIDTSAPPIFALDFAEAIVHIQVKWVYAGARAPIPESPVRTFSHLSTCEILHTSHNWSMTVSANCIRCFFYMLFTQIIWIIV